ncbi:heterokaryon incompatibility protein-domain-containing protein [Apodospora peruviana]|uniref:Heterokaryon incompatibility protein-domain-containing protein n=1 Tax=Apodospora peruviana TaxID=516989 RepID=A0AAE0ICV6_9PEZI|nr:heterokaryon incompatibility protein-domain-containing protein [Apodospora peruviana]
MATPRLSRRQMQDIIGTRPMTLIPLDLTLGQALWSIFWFSTLYYLLDITAAHFILGPTGKGRVLATYLAGCVFLRFFDPERGKLLDPILIGSVYCVYPYLERPGGLNLAFATAGLTGTIVPRIYHHLWEGPGLRDSPSLILRDVIAAMLMASVPWIVPACQSLLSMLVSAASHSGFENIGIRWLRPRFSDLANFANPSWTPFAAPIAICLLGVLVPRWLSALPSFIRSIRTYHLPRFSRNLHMVALGMRQEAVLLIHRAASCFWTLGLQPLKYPSLSQENREIRLLEIQPQGQRVGNIRCNIVTQSLEANPHFEAISHRWNPQGPTRIQIGDNQRVTVSASVYRILRNLQPPPGHKARRIWIDSICIDQINDLEKIWQIDLMTDIYRGADRVVGWMGESPSSRGALSYAVRMLDVSRRAGPGTDLFREHFIDWYANGEYHPRWHSVRSLLSQDWFSRVWIVQEVALAKELVLRHGYDDEELRWDVFADFSRLFLRPDVEPCLRDAPRAGPIGAGMRPGLYLNIVNTGTMNTLRQKRQDVRRGTDLSTALNGARAFDATEINDRVIGLLGFADGPTRMALSAWKKDAAHELFKKVAVHEFVTNRNLSSLHLAGEPCPSPEQGLLEMIGIPSSLRRTTRKRNNIRFEEMGLPSWCPDWISKGVERQCFDGKDRSAASHLRVDVRLQAGSRLLMRGVVFDEILELGETYPTQNRGYGRSLKTIRPQKAWRDFEKFAEAGIELCRRAVRRSAYNHQRAEMLYWRTIFTDKMGDDMMPPAQDRDIEKAHQIFRDTQSALANPNLVPAGEEGRRWVEGLVQGQQALLMAVGANASGRKLCLTRNGYVGLVPATTLPHDWVCLISGAPTPFVVRPVGGGRYVRGTADGGPTCNRFIGSCYVQGITNGELRRKSLTEQSLLFA